ncbi:hypothetical protein [Sphingomonas hengshuiensis]|uniref:Uncharacterized protein n=1 Tax=Sphingomonas hengshuiensis TaxID=1609977 RepID=A0A7U4LGR4_9SPHN|nr:hypothetical protein [Sphingomonas hengshuiensis]AJP73854.1 hypothetical protein TS85_21740 [Sphingomonas hengshuiensis]
MRFLLLALAMVPASALADETTPAEPAPKPQVVARVAPCPAARVHYADKDAAANPRARRMDREPRAFSYLLVERGIVGCAHPGMIRATINRAPTTGQPAP